MFRHMIKLGNPFVETIIQEILSAEPKTMQTIENQEETTQISTNLLKISLINKKLEKKSKTSGGLNY